MMWSILMRRASTRTTPKRTGGRMIIDVAMDMDEPIAGLIAGGKCPTTKVVRRLIILHARSAKLGFVLDCDLVFEAKNKEGDYHREINSTVFMDWFENQLLVCLPHPCIRQRKVPQH